MCGDILHVNWTVMKRSDFCGISISRKKNVEGPFFRRNYVPKAVVIKKGFWEYFAAGNGSFSGGGGDWNVVAF